MMVDWGGQGSWVMIVWLFRVNGRECEIGGVAVRSRVVRCGCVGSMARWFELGWDAS
jgi:hypothetical protein